MKSTRRYWLCNFNPLSPCGERQKQIEMDGNEVFISIHSPHAGRDDLKSNVDKLTEEFQSTLPMRGETADGERPQRVLGYFNPLSPCGERRLKKVIPIIPSVFQSTLPMRGETRDFSHGAVIKTISIHSPHAGRDGWMAKNWSRERRFQSTLPMRGETEAENIIRNYFIFQSTLPMRGETYSCT